MREAPVWPKGNSKSLVKLEYLIRKNVTRTQNLRVFIRLIPHGAIFLLQKVTSDLINDVTELNAQQE